MRFLDFNQYLAYIPAILFAMVVHEYAHAYVSYKFGDQTPLYDGRLSLNPKYHIDPLGFLMLLFVGFGWAKPVHVNTSAYRDAKSGMIWTAFAGPMMNFIVAFLCMFLYQILMKGYSNASIYLYILKFLNYSVLINIGLGLFNLIPLPPLDGSKILLGVLPENVYMSLLRYEQILSIFLMFLLLSGVLTPFLVNAQTTVINFFLHILSFIL